MHDLRVRVALLVALCLIVAACGSGTTTSPSASAAPATAPASTAPSGEASATPEPSPETTSVRVGYTSPDFAQIIPFKWVDDLRADGYTVELIEFEAAGTLSRALIAGEVDFGFGSVLGTIQLGVESGGLVKMVASDNTAPDYLLLAPTSIASVQDLVGKRLGISTPGDISDVLSRIALQREGVQVDQLEIVQIGGTNARIAGLVAGQIDAGVAHAAEAFAAIEQNPSLHNILTLGDIVPELMQRGMLTTNEWIEANPIFTQLLVDRFVDTIRWAADNKDEYIALSKEYVEGLTDQNRDEAYDIFAEIEMFGINGGIDDESLEAAVRLNQEIGTLGPDAPPIDSWADTSFVESYVARNGER